MAPGSTLSPGSPPMRIEYPPVRIRGVVKGTFVYWSRIARRLELSQCSIDCDGLVFPLVNTMWFVGGSCDFHPADLYTAIPGPNLVEYVRVLDVVSEVFRERGRSISHQHHVLAPAAPSSSSDINVRQLVYGRESPAVSIEPAGGLTPTKKTRAHSRPSPNTPVPDTAKPRKDERPSPRYAHRHQRGSRNNPLHEREFPKNLVSCRTTQVRTVIQVPHASEMRRFPVTAA